MSSKSFESEDPLELVGMAIPGAEEDLELMAQAIVQEYLWLGWSPARLKTLFVNPLFLATHRVYLEKGEAYVDALIHQLSLEWHIYPEDN